MSSKTSAAAHSMEQGQLEQPLREAVAPQEIHQRNGRWPSFLSLLGFAFLTFNSGMALYRSNGDLGAVFFVLFSYLDLLLLFFCLRLYEDTKVDDETRREKLKVAVWLLTTMLTGVFSYKVAAIMPFPVQVLVWSMAAATVLGGFWAFFLHSDRKV